jgi:hypothetical protein
MVVNSGAANIGSRPRLTIWKLQISHGAEFGSSRNSGEQLEAPSSKLKVQKKLQMPSSKTGLRRAIWSLGAWTLEFVLNFEL